MPPGILPLLHIVIQQRPPAPYGLPSPPVVEMRGHRTGSVVSFPIAREHGLGSEGGGDLSTHHTRRCIRKEPLDMLWPITHSYANTNTHRTLSSISLAIVGVLSDEHVAPLCAAPHSLAFFCWTLPVEHDTHIPLQRDTHPSTKRGRNHGEAMGDSDLTCQPLRGTPIPRFRTVL